MIDVHCHILPNVDDGSESMEEAIELARISAAEGVTHIIATPHPAPDGTVGSRVFTTERVAELNAALRENEIALEIFPGVETYIDPDMLAMLGSGRIFPLNNGRYVLVEFPYRQAPPSCEKILFAMRVAGYIPIIAHPERYQFVEKDPLWLGRAIEMGCLAQGTGAAFWGAFGSRIADAFIAAYPDEHDPSYCVGHAQPSSPPTIFGPRTS